MARLEELERKFEENPRRYFAPLANEYRKAGDARRAAELCRSQLPALPGHISGHIVLGQALYDAGDFDGSRAALETALALDPENIVALRYLGDISRDTGDAVEAERWYSRTLEADPYNEAAITALQALRETPAAVSSTSESSGADEATAEATTAESPAHSVAAGFEPTSYAPEPEPSGAAESLSAAAIASPIETDEAAPVEQPSETDLEARPEPPPEMAVETPAESSSEAALGAPLESVPETTLETGPEAVGSASEEVVESGAASVEEPVASSEFAGDLAVSAVSESTEPAPDEPLAAEPMIDAGTAEAPVDDLVPEPPQAESPQVEPAERFDVAAHAPPEPATTEEALEAEERVLESAAPFVTETMADLYMEQGYPHEALELLLQLAEQRPQDEQLRGKIEHIESVIVARRDAAVAAARAERAETAEAAADMGPPVAEAEATEAVESADAPFDAAVAEVDSSAFAVREPAEPEEVEELVELDGEELEPAELDEPGADAPLSVREMFARMDRARPRAAGAVTARPISRRRSDFVPMPDTGESDAPADPFAFPNAPAPVPRTSGPQQTFNPSTADKEEFDAWLRGLKGS